MTWRRINVLQTSKQPKPWPIWVMYTEAPGSMYRQKSNFQRALAIRQAKLPETHELIAASYNDLGLVYTQLDVDKAFAYYEKALAIYEKLHGEDHPKLAITNTNLGVLYRSEKLYGDAVNYFEAALKIWEKIFRQPHPNKALVLMNLGQTYSSIGDTKAALGYYERARVPCMKHLRVKSILMLPMCTTCWAMRSWPNRNLMKR